MSTHTIAFYPCLISRCTVAIVKPNRSMRTAQYIGLVSITIEYVQVAWARTFTKVGIGIHCQVLYMFKREVLNNINIQYRSPSHKIAGHM